MILQSESRKNVILGALAALGALWLFAAFIIMPLNERSVLLDRKIAKGTKDMGEVSALAREYMQKSAALPKASINARSLPLTAEVQRIAAELGADTYIKRITPIPARSKRGTEELSLSLKDMPLALFVDFLQKLYESPSVINVMRANVKTGYENRANMTAELTLSPAA